MGLSLLQLVTRRKQFVVRFELRDMCRKKICALINVTTETIVFQNYTPI